MARKSVASGRPLVAFAAVVVGLFLYLVSLVQSFPGLALAIVGLVAGAFFLPPVVRRFRLERYLGSAEFLEHRAAVQAVVAVHNEVSAYAREIRGMGYFELGSSPTGMYASLATFENSSIYKYKRDRYLPTHGLPHVHNCSLQVVRNASAEPIKYLMKYFGIAAEESILGRVELLGSSISRLEGAIANLEVRRSELMLHARPPSFVVRHFRSEFLGRLGAEMEPIHIDYPLYVFEYVSAGGRSGQRSEIRLDLETIDALIDSMAQAIRFRRSVAGQRSLMTSRLRRMIKDRDGHTCQICGISVYHEPHLLLEVDHIIPVSKGGTTTPGNLQALCWRCNRSKGNKVPTP